MGAPLVQRRGFSVVLIHIHVNKEKKGPFDYHGIRYLQMFDENKVLIDSIMVVVVIIRTHYFAGQAKKTTTLNPKITM